MDKYIIERRARIRLVLRFRNKRKDGVRLDFTPVACKEPAYWHANFHN